MIAEQARAHQEREQTRELIKNIQQLAKRGIPIRTDGLVSGRRFRDGSLDVSSSVFRQTKGDWHYVDVLVADDLVFSAEALRTNISQGPLDFTVNTYRTGEWETRVRRMARSKPKGKR